jgi:hypothetical protein
MDLQNGTIVKVNQIVGHGVPLPATGTIIRKSNTGEEEWYQIQIIWTEHIIRKCSECGTIRCQEEKFNRECDVRRDWIELIL